MALSKPALKDELAALLRGDLAAVEQAHRTTREGVTHEEARPENDKDTRALEQSYLARGQAMRALELRTAVAEVQAMPLRATPEGPVTLGALVTVEEEGAEQTLFIAPQGGGSRLAGGRVQVVTPRSPLGRALLGHRAGDDCTVTLAGRVRELVVVRVD